MGLDDVVRQAIATGARLTADFQAAVAHAAATGVRDAKGRMTHAAAVTRRAVVADANELVRTAGGETIVCRTRVTFLGSVAVGLEDRLTLPDGRTPPVRRVNAGILDADAARFVTVVLCD